ncbi:hypothetical protein evm_001673 [Chilo suppressalis]|nr:hypothetical protein evm_001673 [Chilo suppressalis]
MLLVAFTACCVTATHFNVGNIAIGMLEHQTNIKYNAFPFMKRVKQYFYTQPDNRKIVGIQALDNLHSMASINITAGGIGHSFVNLRLKSERGSGLDYSLGIYVEPKYF